MNSKNSDNQENERKAEETNPDEGWQAGATEYDVNYRRQDAATNNQHDEFGNQQNQTLYREDVPATDSMGVEKGAHAGDVPNSDELIHEEVHMLLQHQDIDLSNIELRVKDGEVFLEGRVGEQLDSLRLDEAIAMVAGVQAVHNRLQVIDDSTAQSKRDFPTNS